MIIVSGSSGYVGSELIPLLKSTSSVFGLDRQGSALTDAILDIGQPGLAENLIGFSGDPVIVVHLAAARFDFGAKASDYYRDNVEVQSVFLEALGKLDVKRFVHISSVAAIDGAKMNYSEEMSCDDAYRSTKYLQEKAIERWCKENNVDLISLYPSAIFSEQERSDTNIGKLVKLIRYLPFIPKIPAKKSLTYLPSFSRFILKAVQEQVPPGRYLAIETPVLTVSEMMQLLSKKGLKSVSIPFFKPMLFCLSYVLYALGGFGRVDTKLTPNRVKKLFNDTSYANSPGIDRDKYGLSLSEDLTGILKEISGKNGKK